MKKINFLFLCLLFLAILANSCRRDVAIPSAAMVVSPAGQGTPPSVAVAGIQDSNSYYLDYNPDIIKGNYYISSDVFLMDIDGDSLTDLKIKSACYHSGTGHMYETGIEIVDTSVSIAMTPDSVYPIRGVQGDTIHNFPNWKSVQISASYSFPITFSYELIYYPNSTYVAFPYWNNMAGYVGVRKRNSNGEFRYGWINVGVSQHFIVKTKELYFGGE